MADYSTFRNIIADTIKAEVPNAGSVKYYERNIFDWSKYLAEFVTVIAGKQQTRGWWVSRESRTDDYDIVGGGTGGFRQYNARHFFVVRGILGIQDGRDTDAVFGDLVDDVMDRLERITISGTWETGPAVLRVQEPRVFGPVLCHYAEITYRIQKLSAEAA